MTNWTEDYILSLSIDPATLRDGQKLAQVGRWVSSGANQYAAWDWHRGVPKNPIVFVSIYMMPRRNVPAQVENFRVSMPLG
jgi:hypothetical protein